MNRTNRQRRRGFTLVEVIAATAIMAMLTTASFALVRTANNAWLRHRDDSGQRREAIAALQHIVRRVRQATRVTAISAGRDTSGALTLLMPGGTTAHVGSQLRDQPGAVRHDDAEQPAGDGNHRADASSG